MIGKQGKEGWRDEKGAVRTLQRAWHKDEHEAAIRHIFVLLRLFTDVARLSVQLLRNAHVTLLSFTISVFSSTNEHLTQYIPASTYANINTIQRRVISRVKYTLQRVRHER